MGDDPHQPIALRQICQGPHRLLQGFVIQRSEPLIDKQRIQPDAAGRISSAMPNASARDAWKDSPPDKVLTLRRPPS